MLQSRCRDTRGVETLEPIFAFVRDVSHVYATDLAAAFAINLVVEELFVNMVRYNAGGAAEIGEERTWPEPVGEVHRSDSNTSIMATRAGL